MKTKNLKALSFSEKVKYFLSKDKLTKTEYVVLLGVALTVHTTYTTYNKSLIDEDTYNYFKNLLKQHENRTYFSNYYYHS